MKEIKGTKEEDKTPPAWFTSYMEKVRTATRSRPGGGHRCDSLLLLHTFLPPSSSFASLCSSRTRWFARRWRRSAGSSRDSAASTSPWGEGPGQWAELEVEGRRSEGARPSRSPRCRPPLCPERPPPPRLPAPPAGGRPLEAATSAGA